MTTVKATSLACCITILALGSARSLHAQIDIGTWVRKVTSTQPAMTMEVQACCGEGRRLIYHFVIEKTPTELRVESRLDGSEAPVTIGGKPTAETMAITRVDAHHASTVVKMNGTFFGTSKATLSADGKTLTVDNDFSASAGGMPVGKSTEIWTKQ